MTLRKTILERDYDFTDSMLEQLATYTATNMTRDMDALEPRGITPATVTNLNTLQEALSATPSDIEARALVTEAVEAKEAAYAAALVEARRLRTAAQNVFGEDSGKYKRFGFTEMDKLRDVDFRGALQRFFRVGTSLQSLLAAEGINAAFLDAFLVVIEAYIESLDNVNIAEEARDAQTEDRVSKGNTLYKEIVRLCNIGKDVFATISHAIYNDYVIENYVGPSGIPATSLVIRGRVTTADDTLPVVGAEVLLEDPDGGEPIITVTNGEGRYEFRFNDLPAGIEGEFLFKVNAEGFAPYENTIDFKVGRITTENVSLAVGAMLKAA